MGSGISFVLFQDTDQGTFILYGTPVILQGVLAAAGFILYRQRAKADQSESSNSRGENNEQKNSVETAWYQEGNNEQKNSSVDP